jgi:hypothetical protein
MRKRHVTERIATMVPRPILRSARGCVVRFPLGPEPQFKALLNRLIDSPKPAFDVLEAERLKRPRRKKPV